MIHEGLVSLIAAELLGVSMTPASAASAARELAAMAQVLQGQAERLRFDDDPRAFEKRLLEHECDTR